MVAALALFSKVRLAIWPGRASLKGMLGWSINLFRIRGIMISLHFSFLLLLAYVCDEGWKEAGVPGLWWSAAIFLSIFTCVVLHELGHSFMARRFGVHVRRILLMPVGGMAEFDAIPRKPVQELLIAVAGPAVNFAIASVLWCVTSFPEGWNDISLPSSLGDLGRLLFVANVFMIIFNLIPAFPMDGGRILRALLAMRLPYVRATYWAVTLAKVVTVVGFVLTIYTGRYLTAAICVFIFLFGEAEYRVVKRRETDEAHMKEALDRLYGKPATEEPPVLNG
jgi:Zn-dependent protease